MAAIDAKLKPIEQQAATDATTAHFNAIYSAHPDVTHRGVAGVCGVEGRTAGGCLPNT